MNTKLLGFVQLVLNIICRVKIIISDKIQLPTICNGHKN